MPDIDGAVYCMLISPESTIPPEPVRNKPLGDELIVFTLTVPPKRELPFTTLSAYALVIVSFVPATGAPAMVSVEAVPVVTAVFVAAKVGIPRYVPEKDPPAVLDAAVPVSVYVCDWTFRSVPTVDETAPELLEFPNNNDNPVMAAWVASPVTLSVELRANDVPWIPAVKVDNPPTFRVELSASEVRLLLTEVPKVHIIFSEEKPGTVFMMYCT